MGFEPAIVVKSRLSVLYEPITGIRKKIFQIEEELKEHFLAPNLIPVPDDAPGEIPRIELRSKNGHTGLRFSQIRADMITEYDHAFNKNQQLCFDYVAEKGALFSHALGIVAPDIATTALSFTIRWPQKETPDDDMPNDLSSLFLAQCLQDPDLTDLRINRTIVISDSCYLVSTLNNYRIYMSKTPIETPHPSLGQLQCAEYGLEMELEINDKLDLTNEPRVAKG